MILVQYVERRFLSLNARELQLHRLGGIIVVFGIVGQQNPCLVAVLGGGTVNGSRLVFGSNKRTHAVKLAEHLKGIIALQGRENGDSLFENAVRVAIENNKISTSLLQRKLSIGYGRAAKLIDQMEEMGYVSEADGNKPRRILISKEMFMELVANGTLES